MTSFTELVGCARPLQLAAMGGPSSVELAAAVSEAGGLGMIAASGVPVEMLQHEIEQLRPMAKPFGINFIVPFIFLPAVELAARTAPVIEFFFGDPDPTLVEIGHRGGALVSWQVGSADEARAAVAAGCDLIVAQGIEAGGHVRATGPLKDLLDALTDLGTPIVAAGGIGSPADVQSALESPATAVRIGTRFVAAQESNAHPDYVEALCRSSKDDTVITTEFDVGWADAPARVLRASLEAARTSEDPVGTIGEQRWPMPRFSTMPPTRDARGNILAMPHYAGFSVDHITRRQAAKEIVEELCARV